ncbi:MAG: hypothetical protein GY941_22320 [Planctomycetes bacterium]|nr:hypothetical protein [Planctomycetota bacterium]
MMPKPKTLKTKQHSHYIKEHVRTKQGSLFQLPNEDYKFSKNYSLGEAARVVCTAFCLKDPRHTGELWRSKGANEIGNCEERMCPMWKFRGYNQDGEANREGSEHRYGKYYEFWLSLPEEQRTREKFRRAIQANPDLNNLVQEEEVNDLLLGDKDLNNIMARMAWTDLHGEGDWDYYNICNKEQKHKIKVVK